MMRLDGFGILVKDMGAMIRFYRDVLGFEIKEAEDTANVFLEKDGTLFMLYRRTDFEKMTGKSLSYAKGTNGHYEIALSAADYAAVDRAFDFFPVHRYHGIGNNIIQKRFHVLKCLGFQHGFSSFLTISGDFRTA